MTGHDPDRCAQVRELVPELAMGIAPGEQRAAALAHIATCSDCRTVLELTTDVVDELMLLVPEHEPPVGFEDRVLAAMTATGRRRRATSWLAAAAIVLAAIGGGLAVRWADAGDRRIADQYRQAPAVADGRHLRAATLTSTTGTDAGQVFAYQGNPSWVFMTVEGAPSGTYDVQLVTRDGRRHRIGACWVHDGRGSWGTAVDVPIGSVERIEMRRGNGTTLTAELA